MGNSRNLSYRRVLIPFTEEQLAHVFENHDKDGDGKLSKAELKQAFKYLGSRCSAFRVHEALGAADADGDGIISRHELNKLVDYATTCQYTLS